MKKGEVYNISFFDKSHKIDTNEDSFEIELVRISTIGAEIYDVVMTEKNEAYYNHILTFMKQVDIIRK